MGTAPYPNRLKDLARGAGLKIKDLHRETGIPQRTLYYWVGGYSIIPRETRVQLARIIGCSADDLAPRSAEQTGPLKHPLTVKLAVANGMAEPIEKRSEQQQSMIDQRSTPLFGDRDGCFSFGKLKTTWKFLDGDGVDGYQPQHIRSRYIPTAEELPAELQERRRQIEQEQALKKEKGLPSLWNGAIYSLDRFVIGREPTREGMTLDLWFRPSDYYTYLATNMTLKDPAIRQKYLKDVDWSETVPYFSHSFGISLTVITSDGYTVFTRRGKNVGTLPGTYETSVVEGLSRPIDRGTDGEAPDVYRCACRGLTEELGLREHADFALSDITFLSFGVSTQYALWALRGLVRVKTTIHDLMAQWDNGVRDKFENQQLIPVPFTLQDIIPFVATHESFSLRPTIYHVLVHEFGRVEVDAAIATYFEGQANHTIYQSSEE